MLFPKIKKLTISVNSGMHETYTVGLEGITEIVDKSLEYENFMHNIFYLMRGETVWKEIINMPVVIERFP